ncbi:MAG: hypothetical protein OJF51_000171 [Nitrospira sp.]|nr:MAG: hypothetical protein OJF51_000171 [Nitrospira sp.]
MGPRHLCHGINRRARNSTPSSVQLQWGHGISAMESTNSHTSWVVVGRFNGATASLPWNLKLSKGLVPMDELLQWGHGISAMESTCRVVQRRTQRGASMGPRHLCHGIPSSAPSPSPDASSFNGATASLPWNRSLPVSPARQLFRFNGATASLPWNQLLRKPALCNRF